jgi:hypothetical protein
MLLQDGAAYDCWIVGRHLSKEEQAIAPSATIFHQFVVPPLPVCISSEALFMFMT